MGKATIYVYDRPLLASCRRIVGFSDLRYDHPRWGLSSPSTLQDKNNRGKNG